MKLDRIKRATNHLLSRWGYAFVNTRLGAEDEFLEMYESCKAFTQTTQASMHALYYSMNYVARYEITGEVVECGVWRGGSAMMCAFVLVARGDTGRKIFLYDTFEGMPRPGDKDVDVFGRRAHEVWSRQQRASHNEWNYATLDEVRENMLSTGYPKENLVFIRGRVEDTLPTQAPESVALLRLDTDFYDSTYHELVHLWPRLAPKGVLILDDYGHFAGARRAADEYFEEEGITILLNRIDHSVRSAVKF